MQDAPSFSRLLQIGPDGEPEFITLQELKPHQPLNSPCSYYEQSAMPETNCPTSMFHTSGPGHGLLAPSVITMDRHQTVDSTREELVARKRRNSGYTDLDEDTGDETKSVRTTEDNKKHNHSEIEKRRRDKMNTYITELSSMVPMCHAMSRKLDKLTVLRMAVQHLKTIRGAVHSYTEGYYKPTFLSDKELKTLILKAAEGFLFVVDCDRGRILFVSESVSQILNFSPSDLLGQNWFDILHPKDVAKVKEQLSSSDVSPRERLIDAKTMLPVKTDAPPGLSHLCPGARRSFFCRMKCRQPSQVKEEADTTTGCQHHKQQHQPDRKYCVIHCTGYLKSWSPAKVGLQEPEGDDTNNLSCLVAVGRMMPQLPNLSPSSVAHRSPPNTRTIQFVSRHAMDGKFIFVDQRATLVLGFLPQELLGTSMYEYYHHDDVVHLADAHKTALQSPTNERVTTQVYKFKSRDGSYVKLQSEWKSFRNPWTKDVEYLVAKNCVILSEPDLRVVESSAAVHGEASQPRGNYDFFSPPCNGSSGMEQAITLHMEASKIGRQIADAMLDSHVKQFRDPTPDATPDTQHNQLEESLPPNPMPESGAFGITTNPPMAVTVAPDDVIEMIGEPILPESPIPETDQDANDGNDEAAMAVIMSLLEADAGLGGPVDFSGLPWPLP